MKKKNRVRLKSEIINFSKMFIDIHRNMNLGLKTLNVTNVPEIFSQHNNLKIECSYSIEDNYYFIMFSKNNEIKKDEIEFKIIDGDILDIFDIYKLWNNLPVAFKINNSNISIKDCQISGMKPFQIEGDSVEMYIENLYLNLPFYGQKTIEYGIIISHKKLREKIGEIEGYIKKIANSYAALLLEEKNISFESRSNYLEKLKNIAKEYKNLIYKDSSEHEIETFFKENNLIFEILGLKSMKSQVLLKNILNLYTQDLKPDLIAFNILERRWTIIDYKKSNFDLIKASDSPRATFISKVTDLKAQLREYREYFSELQHREFYLKTYGEYIERPKILGIIGKISPKNEQTFNKEKDELPNWIDILPYNYIYYKLEEYINTFPNIQ